MIYSIYELKNYIANLALTVLICYKSPLGIRFESELHINLFIENRYRNIYIIFSLIIMINKNSVKYPFSLTHALSLAPSAPFIQISSIINGVYTHIIPKLLLINKLKHC